MSNRKKTIIVSVIIVLLVLVASFFGYRTYRYYDFKRAYEKGTTYEQLDVLMNSKRYVKAVRKAGYQVEQSDVFMYGRIPWLVIDEKDNLEVKSPGETIAVSFVANVDSIGKVNAFWVLNNKLKIQDSLYYPIQEDGSDGERVELSTSEEQKLLKEVKKEITDMLKSVYESAY
ncbi:signal peptide [Streptococcus gallolyticus]|uniref:Signal peptide n=1 Tax=Streptococcus gallolyticus TaxID=315405 RepID=A0AA94M264_9STRE|nr:hypothetical protein [Streptococcus gallolyticus]AQP41914.1 hypothetical protein BTR42_04615 [Streptococcus gallolyticus subsp. gallolyticus DSM 16831]SQG79199.1 signal peptide [Streptococcus gallolyticus]